MLRSIATTGVESAQRETATSAELSSFHGERLFVADVDLDGSLDILDCDFSGNLRIVTAKTNDLWTRTLTLQTNLLDPLLFVGGADPDEDGLPEVWVAGDDEPSFKRHILIFEPSGSGSLACVDTLISSDEMSGGQHGVLSTLEPNGKTVFVWNLFERLDLYSHESGEWRLEDTVVDPHPSHNHVYAADLSRNGRDELYWLGNGLNVASLIYERPTTPSAIGPGVPGDSDLQVRVFPTPLRNHAAIWCAPSIARGARRADLFDPMGRLIRSWSPSGGVGSGGHLSAAGLASGVYFLCVCDERGRSLASTRVLVAK